MGVKITYPVPVDVAIEDAVEGIKKQVEARSYQAANELRNSALIILRGSRSGRVYKLPGTYGKRMSKSTKALIGDYGHKLKGGRLYRASAPGEPPAVRFGHFRQSWQPTTRALFGSYIARIESDMRTDNGKYLLGEILEEGSPGGQMAPRPYQEKILEHAEPKVYRIYSAPYD